MPVLLGIDAGSTRIKAAVFTESGRELGVGAAAPTVSKPFPGWRELDGHQLIRHTSAAIRDALSAASISGGDVDSIGVTGAGNGAVLLGDSLQLLRPIITSSDMRARGIVKERIASGDQLKQHIASGVTAHAGNSAQLMTWIKRYEAHVYKDIRYFLMIKDYVRLWLTGRIASDPSDMATSRFFDQHTRSYSPALLDMLDLSDLEPALPPLVASYSEAGRLTPDAANGCGLRPGIPVAAGSADSTACVIAGGGLTQSAISIIAGTWGINVAALEKLHISPKIDYSFFSGFEGHFFAANAMPASARNLDWFVKEAIRPFCGPYPLQPEEIFATCSRLAGNLPTAPDDPIFHPYIDGSLDDSAEGETFARASLLGLTSGHTGGTVMRSILEGVVFGHLDSIATLMATGFGPEVIHLSGGASRSGTWGQLFADVIGLPVLVRGSCEAGCHGAALLGGLAAGIYPDLKTASELSVHTLATYQPLKASAPIHKARFAKYLELKKLLANAWPAAPHVITLAI